MLRPDTFPDRLFDLPLRRVPRLRGRVYCRLAPETFGRGMRIGRGVRFERPSRMRFGPAVIIADGGLFSVKTSAASSGVPDGIPLHVGAKTFFNMGCTLAAETNSIDVGDDVLFGPNAVVVTGTHRFTAEAEAIARQGMVDGGPVVIGDGAWVAAGAIVLGGTTIAPGSVVAANSVVRGHYPDRVLLAGAPARVIRCLDEVDHDEHDNCSERR